MKTRLKILGGMMGIALASSLFSSAFAATVYQNTSNDEATRLSGTTEIGDEIFLNGSPSLSGPSYLITNFTFEYYGVSLGAGAQAEVRFYNNNGAAYGSSFSPGSVIWDSGLFSVANTPRSTLIFDQDFASGLLVPGHFTWSVQFSSIGTDPAASAGVDLYAMGGSTVGGNYIDFWYHDVTGWQLREVFGTSGFLDASFGATLEAAVPEPSSLSLLAGFGVLALLFRKARQTKSLR